MLIVQRLQAKAVGLFPNEAGNSSVQLNSSSPGVEVPEFLTDRQLAALLLPLASVQVRMPPPHGCTTGSRLHLHQAAVFRSTWSLALLSGLPYDLPNDAGTGLTGRQGTLS